MASSLDIITPMGTINIGRMISMLTTDPPDVVLEAELEVTKDRVAHSDPTKALNSIERSSMKPQKCHALGGEASNSKESVDQSVEACVGQPPKFEPLKRPPVRGASPKTGEGGPIRVIGGRGFNTGALIESRSKQVSVTGSF